MSRNIVEVSAPTTSSCGVRTNWRSVRPATVAAVSTTPARGRSVRRWRWRCGHGGSVRRRRVVGQATSAAGRPVRARKTSSSVGRRRPTSSSSTWAAASSRTASASRPVPSVDGAPSPAAAESSTRASSSRAAQQRLDRVTEVLGAADADLDHVASGQAPSARPACRWRSPGRGRRSRRGRPADRPRRGTAW